MGEEAPIQEGETASAAALTWEGMFEKQNRPASPEHQEQRVEGRREQSTAPAACALQTQLHHLPFDHVISSVSQPGVRKPASPSWFDPTAAEARVNPSTHLRICEVRTRDRMMANAGSPAPGDAGSLGCQGSERPGAALRFRSPGSSPAHLLPLPGVETCQPQPRDTDNSLGG